MQHPVNLALGEGATLVQGEPGKRIKVTSLCLWCDMITQKPTPEDPTLPIVNAATIGHIDRAWLVDPENGIYEVDTVFDAFPLWEPLILPYNPAGWCAGQLGDSLWLQGIPAGAHVTGTVTYDLE